MYKQLERKFLFILLLPLFLPDASFGQKLNILITYEPGIENSEVADTSLHANESIRFFAGLYSDKRKFRGEISVNWFWADSSLGISHFLGSGTQIIFRSPAADTGYIYVESLDSYPPDSTGVIKILPGVFGKLTIRDGPGNSGAIVDALELDVGESITLYAAAYDSFGNYLDDRVAKWSSSGLIPSAESESSVLQYIPSQAASGKIYASIQNISDSTGIITVRRQSSGAELFIHKLRPSQTKVNAGQSWGWFVDVPLENEGDLDVRLNLHPDSTFLNFSAGLDYVTDASDFFQSGGLILPAGVTDTLRFNISKTGSTTGPCTISARINTVEIATNRNISASTTAETAGSIVVQTPAQLRIDSLLIDRESAPNRPFVNQGQDVRLITTISNLGQEEVTDIRVRLKSDGFSVFESEGIIPGIGGEASDQMKHHILIASDSSQRENYFAEIVGGDGVNIKSRASISSPIDSNTYVIIQQPAALFIENIYIANDTLMADHEMNMPILLALENRGESSAAFLRQNISGTMELMIDGETQRDYQVEMPSGLLSGASEIGGGQSDTLIYQIKKTGLKGGSVVVRFSLSEAFLDLNDNSHPSVRDSLQLTVISTAAVEIVSTEIICPNRDNAGDGSVNIGQPFSVQTMVRNTGGENLENIIVSVRSDGFSRFASPPTKSISILPTRQSSILMFDLIADSISSEKEAFTVRIEGATASLSGGEVKVASALDSTAHVKIEMPAVLDMHLAQTEFQLLPSQIFSISASVHNRAGTASFDSSGLLQLELPDGYTLANADAVRQFFPESRLDWDVLAPDSARRPDSAFVYFQRIPKDGNDTEADARIGIDTLFVHLETRNPLVAIDSVYILEPEGAKDGVVSTLQRFNIKAEFNQEQIGKAYARIRIPDTFSSLDDETQEIDVDNETVWRLIAPDSTDLQSARFFIQAWGNVIGDSIRIDAIPDSSLIVRSVERSSLKVTAKIASPQSALSGIITPGMEFQIIANIINLGTADTYGESRLEIEIANEAYFEVLGEKSLGVLEEPVQWTIRASDSLNNDPQIISIIIDEIPFDENSNSEAYVEEMNGRAQIAVISELSLKPTEIMIHGIPDIAPTTIVPGEAAILMGVQFANVSQVEDRSVEIAGIKLLVEDGDGKRLSPTSVVRNVNILSEGNVQLGKADGLTVNPIEIMFTDPQILGIGNPLRLYIEAEIEQGADRPFQFNFHDSSYILMNSEQNITFLNESRESTSVFNIRSSIPVITGRKLDQSFSNYPNPFGTSSRPRTYFVYFLKEDADIDISIYTLLGELVWHCSYDKHQPQGRRGLHEGDDVSWDATNMNGQLVLNGVYIARIETGYGDSALRKIAVLK
jgi:hypothetical protein